MDFNIIPLEEFLKDLKSLSKSHRSIVKDVDQLVQTLKLIPDQGIPLGKHCYKIRLAISSKGKGKSGGARLITFVKVIRKSVYLLAIFDKSEMENIDDEELQNRISQIPEQ
jgi:mRNA-degrading endonuclease RelE of RelBE toxin-antitoxin system